VNSTWQSILRGSFDSAEVDLFVASFLALFLELMLIRWVPAYERVLAYFTNFVLIAAFMGLGLGVMMAGRRRRWISWQALLLLAFVAVSLLFSQFGKTGVVADDVYYTEFRRQSLWYFSLPESLGIFFLLIAVVFIPLGQQIGDGLKAISPPLKGYVLNILGSLAGVLAFTALSFLELGAWWWFGAVTLGLLWFVRNSKAWLGLNAVVAVVTVLVIWLAGEKFLWTPYQTLGVHKLEASANGKLVADKEMVEPAEIPTLRNTLGFRVDVSGDFYQDALDLSPQAVSALNNSNLTALASQYDLPFSIPHFPYENILVVGAGTGNDVAAALRGGAAHVDAVEIDPGILRLGQIAHPEQPYSDPRVNVFVQDARTFFSTVDRKYDLIVFGLLDAHRLFSGMSSVRIDSFVYTVESFRQSRRLLKEDGMVVVRHALGNPYLNTRMFLLLADAFEEKPYVHDPLGAPLYFAGPGLKKYSQAHQTIDFAPVERSTDDWPFFYLRGRKLPAEYRVALEVMALMTLVCLVLASHGRLRTINAHFFFLGAAFLLIETVSVTRFALLFGSTWMVNSVVFGAILLVILLANLWMIRGPSFNIHGLYALLAAAVLINFAFPIQTLLQTGLLVRLLVSMILMASPIFFAAFIFAHSYKQTPNAELAFASNLLGAVAGGLLEYSSLVLGFRNLLLIALGLYLLSYLALFRPIQEASLVPLDPLPQE
jgi:MFS family permease